MRKLLLLLTATALAFAGDSSRYREDFHYTYPQTAGGRLALENFNGSVEITGWDQNTVDVTGTKYAESRELLAALRIEVTNSGNETRVKTVRPANERHGNMGAKYLIRVPRRTTLEDVHSSNGALRVAEIEGDARLTTSNGAVRIANVHGNVEAHSSNGGVELNDVDGNVSLRTSNGAVHADNVRGGFEGSTSNGGLHVHLRDTAASSPIRLSSSNGSIDLQMDASRQNDIVASTSNGAITVRMPTGANASLHASTNSGGTVRTDFDVLVRGGELSKHRLDGTIGSGGARLDLTTSNGNISLLRI